MFRRVYRDVYTFLTYPVLIRLLYFEALNVLTICANIESFLAIRLDGVSNSATCSKMKNNQFSK